LDLILYQNVTAYNESTSRITQHAIIYLEGSIGWSDGDIPKGFAQAHTFHSRKMFTAINTYPEGFENPYIQVFIPQADAERVTAKVIQNFQTVALELWFSPCPNKIDICSQNQGYSCK
jgi:hypothetical protein